MPAKIFKKILKPNLGCKGKFEMGEKSFILHIFSQHCCKLGRYDGYICL